VALAVNQGSREDDLNTPLSRTLDFEWW